MSASRLLKPTLRKLPRETMVTLSTDNNVFTTVGVAIPSSKNSVFTNGINMIPKVARKVPPEGAAQINFIARKRKVKQRTSLRLTFPRHAPPLVRPSRSKNNVFTSTNVNKNCSANTRHGEKHLNDTVSMMNLEFYTTAIKTSLTRFPSSLAIQLS